MNAKIWLRWDMFKRKNAKTNSFYKQKIMTLQRTRRNTYYWHM